MASSVVVLKIGAAAAPPARVQGDTPMPPVTIIFRALTPDGHPVLDIKPEELTLKVQGRARAIRSLKLIQFASGAADRKPGPAMPAPYATNEAMNLSRTLLLLVDDESMAAGRERPVRDALTSLLASAPPQDRIGLVAVPRGGVSISPTTDRAALQAAVGPLSGKGPRGESTGDAVCRSVVTLEALKGVFDSYLWESLTTMVYISGGLSPAMTQAARIGTSSGVCELRRENYEETADAALQAPIDLYVAHVPDDSTVSAAATSDQVSGLEHLSGLTGNQLIRLGGTSKPLMDRLLLETSAYYVLTFDPEASERTNRGYRVDLKPSRDRVEIRTKPEVAIGKGGTRSSGPKGPTVMDMLRVGTSYRELRLRAATYAARDSGDKAKLVTIYEPIEPGTKLASGAIGLYDDRSKIIAQSTAPSDGLASGTVISAITAKNGTYRLRVAAIDSNGRRGAVDLAVVVDLAQAEGVKYSTLVLGRAGERGFTPALQFGTDASAIAYLELYGAPKAANVAATIELATTPGGNAFISTPATIPPARSDDARMISGEIPIAMIPPGDFELRVVVTIEARVVVTIDGRPEIRAATTLRKVLK